MTIFALGVVSESSQAKDAGLETGLQGGSRVNEQMQTSEEDIYAMEAAMQVRHCVSGKEALIDCSEGTANKQGRMAVGHICGFASAYRGALEFPSLRFWA